MVGTNSEVGLVLERECVRDKNYSWVWPIVLIILECVYEKREGVGGVVATIFMY